MYTHAHAAKAGSSAPAQDPIQLHFEAINSLSRCKAMLTANEPMYHFALESLAAAKLAIESLNKSLEG